MSIDAHAEALKSHLTDAAGAPAMDLDEIKALGSSLPPRYIEVYLQRRFGGETRLAGRRSNRLRRLSTRVVADTVTNGRLLEDKVHIAFATSVDLGDAIAHVEYETGGGAFEQDEGHYTAITDWTFRA